MGILKSILKYAAPVIGAAAGSYFGPGLGLSSGIGGALGGALGGAIGGGKKGRISGALGGGALGYMAGPSISGGISSLLGKAGGAGNITDFFGGKDIWGNGGLPSGSLGSITSQLSGHEGVHAASGGAGGAAANLAKVAGSAAAGGAPAAAAGAGAGVAGAAGGASGGIMGGLGDLIKNNPSLLAGGISLLSNFAGEKAMPGEKQLKQIAKQQQAMTNNYLNGSLSPADQSAVDNATNDAEAAIRSKYASMGLSGSTMEMQEIAGAKERSKVLGKQLATTTLNNASQALGLSSQLYSQIMNYEVQKDNQLADAISSMTSALGFNQGLQAA